MANRAESRTRPRADAGTLLGRRESLGSILTAAVTPLGGSVREQYALQYRTWQDELWNYTKSIGPFGSVMDWFASGISRMHLVAAIQKPGLREPEMIDKGPAADLVNNLVTDARGGETQYLYKWGRHLGVAGVGWFVGEDRNNPEMPRIFDVKSPKQIRRAKNPFKDGRSILRDEEGNPIFGFDVEVAPGRWRPLGQSSLVGRIFRPDDELDYEVNSWARPALTTLREIDLYNRHIIATLLSRLVFNGFLLIPEEITFPVNPQFKDAPDPFIAELLAIGARGIRDPGSPGSAIPVPLRLPAQYIDKIVHLAIANSIDPKVIEARSAALANLSKELPAPPEAMEGKGELNHWNAWKDAEDNIKHYFGATMEVLVGGLTELYLWPMLRAANQSIKAADGGRLIIWYDASDLIAKPDNSENAIDARERLVIDDEAYRKVVGLDGADTPSDEELRKMILVNLARQGVPIPDSFYLLYPKDKPDPAEMQVAGAPVSAVGPSPGNAPATSNNGKTGAQSSGPPRDEPARAGSSPSARSGD
jgi:hypothetical protein